MNKKEKALADSIASKLNKYYVKTIVPKHGDIFNFNKKEKKNVNK
tara:strand:- start:5996 stop:6130 length:135 start_codon:yes stop_codon:yes gene_type:complete